MGTQKWVTTSSILSILSGLSSLKSLDLSLNKLTGSGIIHSFYLIASLDNGVLDLSENRFNNDKSILSCFNGLPLSSLWIYQTMG